MDLIGLYRLCRRHLIVLLVAGSLAIAFVGYVVITSPPVYRAAGSTVLLPPESSPDVDEPAMIDTDNPLVLLDDLSVVVDVLERQLSSPATLDRLQAAGLTGSYEVGGNDLTARGPIIELRVFANTESEALEDLELLLVEQAAVLEDLQMEYAEEERITGVVVAEATSDSLVSEAGVRTATAASTVLLVAPEPVVSDEPPINADNPYIRLNDMSVVVDLLKRVMASAPVEERMREDGLVGTYLVAANTDFYRGPIIDMTVDASTPEDAIRGVDILLEEQAAVLDMLQADQGTDAEFRITTEVVNTPTGASRVLSSTLRRGIAVMVLAGGAVLAALLLADAFSRVRARRKGKVDDAVLAAESPPPPAPSPPRRRSEPAPRAGRAEPVAVGASANALDRERDDLRSPDDDYVVASDEEDEYRTTEEADVAAPAEVRAGERDDPRGAEDEDVAAPDVASDAELDRDDLGDIEDVDSEDADVMVPDVVSDEEFDWDDVDGADDTSVEVSDEEFDWDDVDGADDALVEVSDEEFDWDDLDDGAEDRGPADVGVRPRVTLFSRKSSERSREKTTAPTGDGSSEASLDGADSSLPA